MPVTVSIELLSGGYEASSVDDRERSEWPPHPARVYCALTAAARGDTDRAALEWLEARPAPVILAAPPPHQAQRAAYVVVNALSGKGGSQTHPGRTNGLRTRSRAIPTNGRVTMTWAGDAPPGVVAALDEMARRVPYLGRSTGVALLAASATGENVDKTDVDGAGGELVRYEPCALLDQQFSVRVPYGGFLAELDAQFTTDRPAWEVSRYQGYRLGGPAAGDIDVGHGAGDAVVPSVYTDLLVLRFAGVRPQARLATRFTGALRSAVLAVAGDQAPGVLHGHGADGRPHVAFLALPDVGGEHSDGHLLGLAVAIPDLPEGERRAVLAAVGGLRRAPVDATDTTGRMDRGFVLPVPGIGDVELLRRPEMVRPWGADPRRWRRGSRRWASATPIVLDRYPKRADRVADEVRASMRRVGLPEPVEVQISHNPFLPGAAQLRPSELPARAKGRPFVHVAVRFERRVSGPVLVGAGRYLGIGLLAPLGGEDA